MRGVYVFEFDCAARHDFRGNEFTATAEGYEITLLCYAAVHAFTAGSLLQ